MIGKQEHAPMSQDVISELAPTGVLRAGINLSNFLLVTGRSTTGDPEGVSPDMAREIANRLGVPVKYVPYKTPGELADMGGTGAWDIGLIGAEPQRAAVMTFSAAYVEIEATYMVPPGSPLKSIVDVDKKGVRVAVSARSAYGLWLENNLKNAELVQVSGLDGAFKKFMDDKLDALAGLRPGLLKDLAKHPELKILDGKFTAVQQAVGCNKPATESARYIAAFVENAKKSGLVASLIEKHKVKGLSVAPLA
jgi:polar amino acid transport system substrate-binding protein